ncbi:MAG: carbohydrate ABC transporter substrate-binding protein [Clostridia bacterium]|nr:carbohydrate ABC transporter substrate-binding protein [Clostridia bacterium]
MKKILALALALAMLLMTAGLTASAEEVGQPMAEKVSITMMNSKPEITAALQAAADLFGAAYNVSIEVTETSSPGDELAKRYNAGDAPTISIVDIANVKDLAREDKILDLGDQPWAAIGGKEMGAVINDVLYGMPLTIESKALLVNKTAVEKITGETFDPLKYQTKGDFEALLQQLREGGMENPVIINQEDWSIGSHFVQYFYGIQDGTIAGAEAFIEKVRAGEESFADNAVFNACMDMFDLYMEYNINKQDPLSADYDLNADYLAEGEAAFWINGTWAWPNMVPFVQDDQEYTIMHMPTDAGAQGKLLAQATKYIVVDKADASAEAQEAAKKFLNWLIYTEEGQNAMINECGMVTAFTNITLPPSNPFNVGLKNYIDAGLTCEAVTYLPSDHRSALGANMQKYLDGSETREEVAKAFDAYWAEHEVNY